MENEKLIDNLLELKANIQIGSVDSKKAARILDEAIKNLKTSF